jgi:hypothetical protein
MSPTRVATCLVAALCAGLAFRVACGVEATPAGEDEFIVRAKALEGLRLKIKLAENEAYARFNELNTDHSHDIQCFDRTPTGSRIASRWCVSNAWRKASANIASAYVRGLQSASSPGPTAGVGSIGDNQYAGSAGYGAMPGKYYANQLHTEELIRKELTKVAYKDPELHEAMQRVAEAHIALESATGSRAEYTLYRDVAAGDDGLPFGAKRVIEVRVGDVAWNHPLTSRTFTIGSVTGEIRGLRLRCERFDKNLDYEKESEWTVPGAWSDCALVVRAKQGTTFALYEF